MVGDPPRPAPSPQPPTNDGDGPTGVHNATRDFVREVNRSGLFKVSWAMVAWVGFIAIGAITGWKAMAADSRDAGTAMIAPIDKRLSVVEQQIPQLREEVFEARKDMRELQNVILTRKRSERLDEPVPPPSRDGGR